jgi:hypothetical protein
VVSRLGIMTAGQELDATAQALTGLLAGLTAGHARQALAAAVAGNGDVRFHAARYYSLRRFLAAHPGALSSGAVITAADRPRLVAPQDVKRLAAALLAAGRADVAIPVRRCAAGRHDVRDNWSARQGCIRCDTGHALADCVRLVTALLDGMPGDQARNCLLTAAGGGTSRNTAARLRVIAAHLRGEPDALASGETIAPIDVLRLISELRRAGRSDVAQPRCADCGRDRFLRAHRPDGQRVCASCSQAYHLPERCGPLRAASPGLRPRPRRLADLRKVPARRPRGLGALRHLRRQRLDPRHHQRHPDRRLLLPAPARTLLSLRDRPRRQPLQNPQSHLRQPALPARSRRAVPAAWMHWCPKRARRRCACAARRARPARALAARRRLSTAPQAASPAARAATPGPGEPAGGAGGCASSSG